MGITISNRGGSKSNTPNASTRCKSRRGKLLDRTQLRQLIQQSPEQLASSVADKGYRNEIDLYSTKFEGSDLLEMALTHRLTREINEVMGFCKGNLLTQVEVYANRFSYFNTKVVLRAVENNVSAEDLAKDILPEENEWNVNWLEIVKNSENLTDVASALKNKPWGRAISSLGAEATLANYEDSLDKHYYKESISSLKGQNIANVNTVGGISGNVTTVAGISGNVSTVAGISSNVTTVATNNANVTTVAGKATEIGRLGTADAVADMAILGTTDVVADMNTLATTAIVSDMDTLADIASDITTVADNDSNITAVAGNATNINAAVSNESNINNVVSAATNINSVAGNSTNINAVAGNATNINTVAGANSNITTVAGSISNINTTASNISDVNNFANRYRIANSAPTSSLDQGDLYFDTSSNELRVYNGSAWQGGVTATGNLPSNGANTFTGDQTVQANIIVTGTVDGRDVATDGSKLDGIEASATADQTAAEIRTLVESASDSNVFTDADHSKLNGIAAGATNVTNTNQLTNGAGFITATLTNEQVQVIVGAMVSGLSLIHI